MKTATTIEEQIDLLQSRGMKIEDPEKAKEVLLDIGYYRLGFYGHPFEKTTQDLGVTHQYQENTSFRDVVDLYYFDCNLRDFLMPALHRIEVNFRTRLTYYASNAFKDSPTWFVDTRYVDANYANSFDGKVYNNLMSLSSAKVIAKHHKKYINDRYAPAWKTLEFMTFGAILNLFKSINNQTVKIQIAKSYGIDNPDVLQNYMRTVLNLRNLCAHASALFDASLPMRIRTGLAKGVNHKNNSNVFGAIAVVLYLLGKISENRTAELKSNLSVLLSKNQPKYPNLLPIDILSIVE